MLQNVTVRALCGFGLSLAIAAVAPSLRAKAADNSASQAKDKKKVLVGAFSGPKSDRARKAVILALKDDGAYDVVESSDAKPGADDKSYVKASAGASAVLVGTVSKRGLVLSVRNGADGTLVEDVTVNGASPAKLDEAIADTLALSIADPIARSKAGADSAESASGDEPAASSEEEAPAEDAPPEDAPPEAAEAPSSPSPFEFTAGLRAVHRSFTFHDTPAERFPARRTLFKAPVYTLPLGPALFFDASLYPFAFGSRGFASMIGIIGGYEVNFATQSAYGTPEKTLNTKASQFYAGLKLRVPVGAHEFGLFGAYGQQLFTLEGDESAPLVPDLKYTLVRLGAEGRLRFDALSIGVHAGTRLVFNTGPLHHDRIWFPAHVTTTAFEAGISAGYTLIPNLDLVTGLDLLRYAFDFNPQNPNANPYTRVVAGGAVDQYISAFLGLRYALTGHVTP